MSLFCPSHCLYLFDGNCTSPTCTRVFSILQRRRVGREILQPLHARRDRRRQCWRPSRVIFLFYVSSAVSYSPTGNCSAVSCVIRSVKLKDEATVSALKEVLDSPSTLQTLESLQKETLLSPATFLQHFAAIRSAIHTKCFLEELQETGLIFSRVSGALKDVDPQTWDKIKGMLHPPAGHNHTRWACKNHT